jgi:hypothetical protein
MMTPLSPKFSAACTFKLRPIWPDLMIAIFPSRRTPTLTKSAKSSREPKLAYTYRAVTFPLAEYP